MMKFNIVKHWLVNNILGVAGIGILLYFFGNFIYTKYHLSKYRSYTSGSVVAITKDWKGNKLVKYTFYIKGKSYYGMSYYDERYKIKTGSKYRVTYSWANPEVSYLDYSYLLNYK